MNVGVSYVNQMSTVSVKKQNNEPICRNIWLKDIPYITNKTAVILSLQPYMVCNNVYINNVKKLCFTTIHTNHKPKTVKKNRILTDLDCNKIKIRFPVYETLLKVSNLSPEMTEKILEDAFQVYGQIVRCIVDITDSDGIIEYFNKRDALAVLMKNDGLYYVANFKNPVRVTAVDVSCTFKMGSTTKIMDYSNIALSALRRNAATTATCAFNIKCNDNKMSSNAILRYDGVKGNKKFNKPPFHNIWIKTAEYKQTLNIVNELIADGQIDIAMHRLYEVILNETFSSKDIVMPLVQKYFTLCIERQEANLAKTGFSAYKDLFLGDNVISFMNVIQSYLSLVEERTKIYLHDINGPQELSNFSALGAFLESNLGSIIKENEQETLSSLAKNWLWFLVESYTNCFDLLWKESRFEELYHCIARKSLAFSLQFGKPTLFTKLHCILRVHARSMLELKGLADIVDVTNFTTFESNFETGLIEAFCAIKMGLIYEACQTMKDISNLIYYCKLEPRFSLKVLYYNTLIQLFWKAHIYDFHALFLIKLFYLYSEPHSNLKEKEKEQLAAIVTIAVLSVPVIPEEMADSGDRTEMFNKREADQFIRFLFNSNEETSKFSLFKSVSERELVSFAPAAVQSLFCEMRDTSTFLAFCNSIKASIEWINCNSELNVNQYSSYLQENLFIAIIQLILRGYQAATLESLREVCWFLSPLSMRKFLRKFMVFRNIEINIDDNGGIVYFGMNHSNCQIFDLKNLEIF